MQRKKSKKSMIIDALTRMRFISQEESSVFLVVFVLSCVALIIFLQQIFYQTENILLYGQMVFWLWMTIFLAFLVESITIDQNSELVLKRVSAGWGLVKKLNSLTDIHHYEKVTKKSIKTDDLILLKTGDEVPFDGELVKGRIYVNETNNTGTLELKLKSPTKDNLLVTGSIIDGTDRVIMKVSFSNHKSFFTRITRLLRNINRQAMPSEIALQRLMLGLSLLFISVLFVIWSLANYVGLEMPIIYLIGLMVILLPTTMSSLQRIIIYNGKLKLYTRDIIVQDQVAFDNAVDINVVLLDKTGTLTFGERKMIEFKATVKGAKEDYLRYLYLSSVNDNTQEGKSITSFVIKNSRLLNREIKTDLYEYLPFSASHPISGCNYDNLEIRKGSLKTIAKYLGKTIQSLPKEIQNIIDEVAKTHGTPLIFVVNKKILGVINLRDNFRNGVEKQISDIQNAGISTIMLTGDNSITASYVAKKLGVKKFYADSTPEKKLKLVKSLQEQGLVVAMCGDGVNDALALAQADIGYIFADKSRSHTVLLSNIIAKNYDLSAILELKNECKKITVRRGGVTVYSIISDLAKYFVIVPVLFSIEFPALSKLNVMQFHSPESALLSSVIFNALIIPCLAPLTFYNLKIKKDKTYLWRIILFCGFGGLVFPFLFIKLIEFIIYRLGLI
ncbi:MAG: HAD-IC family P-type ATPase [Rickettsiaceae bacterium]